MEIHENVIEICRITRLYAAGCDLLKRFPLQTTLRRTHVPEHFLSTCLLTLKRIPTKKICVLAKKGCSKDLLSFLQPLNKKQKSALLSLVSIWIRATQGTNTGQEHKK